MHIQPMQRNLTTIIETTLSKLYQVREDLHLFIPEYNPNLLNVSSIKKKKTCYETVMSSDFK